ncbi:MAG: hypothetical protein GY759_00925 [Chloroflexi bacterium]|nr:hypothetical protein [Chloroflexota bacterium]
MILQWSRVILGIFASILISLLGLAAVMGLVIAFSAANSIQDVQSLSRYGFLNSVLFGLGCVWGSYITLRRLSVGHVLHGFLIGLGVGLVNFTLTDTTFIGNLITLLLTLPAGVLGARMAELNPRPRSQ